MANLRPRWSIGMYKRFQARRHGKHRETCRGPLTAHFLKRNSLDTAENLLYAEWVSFNGAKIDGFPRVIAESVGCTVHIINCMCLWT